MKNKRYLKENIECFLLIILISLCFFIPMTIAGNLAGFDLGINITDFSWDMINTWEEIMHK